MANQSDIKLNIQVSVTGQQTLQSLQSTIQRVSAANANAASGMTKTAKSAQQQAVQMSGLAQKLTEAETKYDALYRASYRLQIVGYQLIGAGQNMIGMIKSLTDGWGNFEFMINRAAASMDIWKNTAKGINPIYNALIDNVEQATKDLRLFPADDVAKATYFWGSTTGQTVKTLGDLQVVMNAVNPLMKVAAMTQVGYEAAIKGVYSILVQYGRSLNDVGDITAKLFVVTQKTALEFPDLITSFKMVGPIAASLGVTFEDVAAILGQLGDAGLRGSLSGRALRQVFIQLARPTAKASAALDILFKSTKGINKSFQDTVFPNGQFIGITQFVDKLAFALKDATQAQKAHLLATISTANELPVLTVLVGNQIKVLKGIPGAYDTAKASVTDAQKAAQDFNDSWSLLANSWNGIVGRITAGAEVIKLKIGRDIADALRPAIERVTLFLDKIEKWVTLNPQIVTSIGKVVGSIAAIATVAGSMLVAIGSALGLYSALGFLITGFGKLIAPVTIVSGLLTTLGEAVLRNWTRIADTIGPAFARLTGAFSGQNSVLNALQDVWSKAHKTISDFMDFIVRVGVSVIAKIINLLADLAHSPAIKFLSDFAAQLSSAVVIALTVMGAVKIMVLGFGLLKGALALVISPIKAVFAMVESMVAAFYSAAASGGAIAGFKAALMSLSFTGILAIVTGLVMGFQALASINFLGFGDFIKNLTRGLSEINSEIKDLVHEFGAIGPQIQESVTTVIAPQFKAMGDAAQAAADKAKNATGRARAYMERMASNMGADAAKKQADAIEHAIAGIKQAADDAGVSMSDFGVQFVRGMNIFSGSIDKAKQYATDFFSIVKGGSPTVQEAITLWNTLARQGQTPTGVSPEQFLRTTVSPADLQKYYNDFAAQAQIALARADLGNKKYSAAYQILVGLQLDGTQYSDDVKKSIDTLMAGVPEAIKGVVADAADIATKAPKDIADAVIAGVSAITSFKTDLKKALSGLMDPKTFVTDLLGNLGSADLKKAFSSNKVGAGQVAQGAIDSMTSAFADALGSAMDANDNGKTLEALQAAARRLFTPKDFQKALDGTLTTFRGVKITPAQAKGFQAVIDSLFPELMPLPSASVVGATSAALGKKIPKILAAEFDPKYNRDNVNLNKAGNDAMKTAVDGMQTTWYGVGRKLLGDTRSEILTQMSVDLYSDGYKTMTTFVKGVGAAAVHYGYIVTDSLKKAIGSKVIANSPPKEGPLKNIDKDGFSVGRIFTENVANGIMGSIDRTSRAVMGVQDSLGIENGGLNSNLNVDTNQSRHITVDVNVSSPDGSVSRMDMKTLAGALSGTSLTRAIEQAAAAR